MPAPVLVNPLQEELGRALRIRQFAGDLGGFAAHYLGHTDSSVYREWDDLLLRRNRAMVEAPVGHGKSYRFTFAYPLHRICYNRNVRILIVSKTAERAAEFVERIGKELETNKLLRADYGDWAHVLQVLGRHPTDADHDIQGFYDVQNWTKNKFTVRRPKNLRESTVTGSGVGGQIEGLRLDEIIADDVLDVEDRTSEIEREQKKEWFRSTLVARLEPLGGIHVVGTPWSTEDLYAELETLAKKPESGWTFRRYQALPGWTGDPAQPVPPLIPWRWSYDALLGKFHEIGPTEFEAKYQCNPRASEGHWFKEKWLQWYKAEALVDARNLDAGFDRSNPDYVYLVDYVMGCDFNLSDASIRDSDYTALVVLGRDVPGNFYVVDVRRERLTDGHADAVANMWLRYKPSRIAVEANLFQRLIYKQLCAVRPDVPAIPIVSTQQKAHRILRLQPFFQQGRIRFPKDKPDFPLLQFIAEYAAFPSGKHDDMLDALQMCFEVTGYWNQVWGADTGAPQVLGAVSDYFRPSSPALSGM